MQALLGVAIGVVLVFAVMAVVVSSTMELVSAVFRMRSHALEQGIARMLDGRHLRRSATSTAVTADVMNHPLIKALSSARGARRPPSYIDAVTFATALVESSLGTASIIAAFLGGGASVTAAIAKIPPGVDADVVKAAWGASSNDPTKLVGALMADQAHGTAAIVALASASLPAGSTVDDRLQQLQSEGVEAEPALRQAWTGSNGDVNVFMEQIQQPTLFKDVENDVAHVDKVIADIKSRNAYVGGSLEALWHRAGKDFGTFRHEIEDWFDREMARVSGWYSRWSQWIMVGIALVIVGALNISTVTVGKTLWYDPSVRDAAVKVAEQVTRSKDQTPNVEVIQSIRLPIGWDKAAWPGLTPYLALHILGMILVAIAASFGAPFWFDVLNRLVNLRTSGRPPPTAADQRVAGGSAP